MVNFSSGQEWSQVKVDVNYERTRRSWDISEALLWSVTLRKFSSVYTGRTIVVVTFEEV